MDYLENLKKIFIADAHQRFYGMIPDDHVWPRIPDGNFEPDTCYLRIWLNDMYLAHKRVLYQTRCPVVHSTCRFSYADAMQELRLVVGSGQSRELGAALDHAVSLNYPLFGPVPYRGGDVELLVALMAMEKTDYGDKLLDVLGMLSQMTASGELRTVLPLLAPLKRGAEGLFGMEDLKVHLGMHDAFSGGSSSPNRLKSGYRVVMDVTGNRIDLSTLWVRDGRLCSGPDFKSATPFEGSDFFMFYIEKAATRGDDILPVREAWNATIEKAAKSDEEEVDLALTIFKAIVLTSPDLIWDDQQARILKLIDRIRAIRTLNTRRGFTPHSLDTSLKGALSEPMEMNMDTATTGRQLSRKDMMGLNWR